MFHEYSGLLKSKGALNYRVTVTAKNIVNFYMGNTSVWWQVETQFRNCKSRWVVGKKGVRARQTSQRESMLICIIVACGRGRQGRSKVLRATEKMTAFKLLMRCKRNSWITGDCSRN